METRRKDLIENGSWFWHVLSAGGENIPNTAECPPKYGNTFSLVSLIFLLVSFNQVLIQ